MIPEWLKDTDWANLQLVTLRIANMEKLPDYIYPGTVRTGRKVKL